MPPRATPFGGRAGAMLSRTASITSVFTGLVFLAVAAGVAALASYAPHEIVPALVLHFVISFFVAHFAIEGYSDEWERAGRPIPTTRVAVVALRYMAISLVLFVPLALAVPWRAAAIGTVTTPTLDAVLLLAYALLVMLAPPALLVASVSAASWTDLVSTRHWGSRFRGRAGDFFLIYVVFIGAVFCMLLAGLPLVALAATSSVKAMTTAAAALVVFATGFCISLLGRLCGSFAVAPPAADAAVKPPPVLHPSLARERPVAGAASATPVPGTAPRKTALLDAGARVDALRTAHAGDAAALVSALQEIDDQFLPHAAVRQALVMALLAAGRHLEAATVAREAIPLCLRSGNVGAGALIYEALLETGAPPELSKEQLLSIADTLKGMKHAGAAVDVYATVLRADPADARAMKGTIAVAQELSQQKNTAAVAVRVYDALIATCPGSPLLDFVKAERLKASRKAET